MIYKSDWDRVISSCKESVKTNELNQKISETIIAMAEEEKAKANDEPKKKNMAVN